MAASALITFDTTAPVVTLGLPLWVTGQPGHVLIPYTLNESSTVSVISAIVPGYGSAGVIVEPSTPGEIHLSGIPDDATGIVLSIEARDDVLNLVSHEQTVLFETFDFLYPLTLSLDPEQPRILMVDTTNFTYPLELTVEAVVDKSLVLDSAIEKTLVVDDAPKHLTIDEYLPTQGEPLPEFIPNIFIQQIQPTSGVVVINSLWIPLNVDGTPTGPGLWQVFTGAAGGGDGGDLIIQEAMPTPLIDALWIPLNSDGTPKLVPEWQIIEGSGPSPHPAANANLFLDTIQPISAPVGSLYVARNLDGTIDTIDTWRIFT